MHAGLADEVISSRLLILQSKRLMLRSLERRLGDGDSAGMRGRVERMRADVGVANQTYIDAMLKLGSASNADYWLVAYGRLIEMGNSLGAALRLAAIDLPLAERYQASSDVEMMEHLVGGWTESLRKVMAEAVA
jgi:hypothetical protein